MHSSVPIDHEEILLTALLPETPGRSHMTDSKPLPERELYAQMVSSSFIMDLIYISDPREMAQHLCEQMLELTGAQTVAFAEFGEHDAQCRSFDVCPSERTSLFDTCLNAIYPACLSVDMPCLVSNEIADHPLKEKLEDCGIKSVLIAPVRSAEKLVGAILLLDIPESRCLQETISLLDLVSPAVGVMIENFRVRNQLEQYSAELEKQVQERTDELERTNRELRESRLAALNMMEDAILAREKVEFEHNLFASFMDSLPAAVFFIDADGYLVSANKALERLCDERHAVLIGKTLPDLFGEDDAARIKADERLVLQRSEPVESELLIGGRCYQSVQAPWYQKSGDVAGIYAILWDISDLRSAEKENIDLARFPEENINPVMRFSADGELMYGNRASEELKSVLLTFNENHLTDIWMQRVEKCLAQGKPVHRSFSVGQKMFSASLVPVESRGYVNLYAHDSTHRIAAEQRMAESRNRFATLLSNLPGMAYRCVEDGAWTMIFVSDGCKALTGYTASELTGDQQIAFDSLIHPDDRDMVRQHIHSAVEQREHYEIEYRIIHRSGTEHWVWERGVQSQVSGNGQVVLDGFIVEITDRKRLQAALEKRLLALTRPSDSSQEIAFEELFSLEEIQRIQDEFAAATDVASIITRPDGTPITRPSNFSDFCKMVRSTGQGCRNCMKSDAAITEYKENGPLIHVCASGACYDAGAKIVVGGHHIANWLIGQVRNQSRTDEQVRAYAREIGVDEDEIAEAFDRLPSVSYDRFQDIADALYTLARQLSNSAYQNLQQSRYIAEQRNTEEKLEQLSEEQSLILNNSMMGIALIRDRKFEWVNNRLAKMLNRSLQEIQHQPTRILYPTEELYQQAATDVYSVLKNGKRADTTVQFKRKDGSLFWCRLAGIAIDAERPNEGSIWFFDDVTSRKENIEELQRLSTAIEYSPEAIVVTDTRGHIQYVNPAFEQITGYSREEALGQNPSVLKSGVHDDEFYEGLWSTIRSGQVWEGRFTNKRKDGSLFTEEASIAPVRDAQGVITNYVAVKRDITLELEREAELAQSQKMEAVGLLAGGVAHDFNNILQGIMGFSSLLLNRLTPDTREYTQAYEIRKASTRAAELTQQLLAFSRKENAEPSALDLNNVINDVSALLDILLGENIEIELDLEDSLNLVHADQSQLSQIIMNLAVNARDAMLAGGVLTISTRNEVLTKEVALPPDVRPGKHVCLSVADTGVGMKPETQERLFEPFFTTKQVGKGSGLGLSVVYGIVKQNNGWIQVESELGKGSTFNIYFPVCKDVSVSGNSVEPSEGATKKILLVDDDEDLLKINKSILETVKYIVHAVPDAEQAQALFEQENGMFDLLITDMKLPGRSGIELADCLRKQNPELAVLVCSGYKQEIDEWDSLHERGYHSIEKPVRMMVFLSAVQEAIG